VEGEDFAAAHAGAEQDLEQVGQLIRVLLGAVAQEGGGLFGGPAGAFGGAGLGRHGVLGRVVAQAPGADGVALSALRGVDTAR
jgi:hypothetical protein